ncbi:hypothetical protein PIB30_058212, partial [Stylosanthes scabra]|nr:hypothetical protein [Stylosanthes scabra]
MFMLLLAMSNYFSKVEDKELCSSQHRFLIQVSHFFNCKFQSQFKSINPRGNDTHSPWYYLIRSGALADGGSELRKDFSLIRDFLHFDVGSSLFACFGYLCMQGNHRNRQFFEYNPEIERILTKNRNRVKAQKALQGEPSEGQFSEEFSEEEIEEEIFEEKFQDNMADDANNNKRKTLADFIVSTTASCGTSIVRPTVEANNFELKPSLIHL